MDSEICIHTTSLQLPLQQYYYLYCDPFIQFYFFCIVVTRNHKIIFLATS